MSNILFSSSRTISSGEEQTAPNLSGMVHLWRGWDGSVWDLSDPSGTVTLGSGVLGMGMPEVDWYATDSPAVDGSTDRGFRVSGRTVLWPLLVTQAGRSQQWIDTDSAFWRTLQPGRYGTWEVQQPNGMSRSLRVRLDTDNAPAFGLDPALSGRALYAVRLACPEPYWSGPAEVRQFLPSAPAPFFGPVFTISRSSSLSNASLSNQGDVEAWPVWTVIGPTSSVSVGLNGHAVQVPFAVATGKALVIDTDPRMQTAFEADVTTVDGLQVVTKTSVERTGELGTVDYAAIPSGVSVPLTLLVTGAGSVSVSIRPRYLRAW